MNYVNYWAEKLFYEAGLFFCNVDAVAMIPFLTFVTATTRVNVNVDVS